MWKTHLSLRVSVRTARASASTTATEASASNAAARASASTTAEEATASNAAPTSPCYCLHCFLICWWWLGMVAPATVEKQMATDEQMVAYETSFPLLPGHFKLN